ncbi:hypothetical protein GCM10020331_044260 [Ectobacillus funiculus]
MKGKVVVVTGGSSGMGKAMAFRFACEGAYVVITGRTLEALEQAKREIEQFENQVLVVQMDVREPKQAQQMVQSVDVAFGRIDYLVNNAAGNFVCPAEELSVNGWNAVINIVLNGTFYCSSAVGKYWIEKGDCWTDCEYDCYVCLGCWSWCYSFCIGKSGRIGYDSYACGGVGEKIWDPRKRHCAGAD